MPKIVDRAKYQSELAMRAVPVFRNHGYSAVGMREIASELGVSKSALYHYFPTKKDLFAACCAWVTKAPERSPHGGDEGSSTLADVMELVKEADSIFRSDLRLLLDYMRTLTPQEAAADESLQSAFQPYSVFFDERFGKQVGELALYSTLGALLVRALGSDQPSLASIEARLASLMSPAATPGR
jgi:TetR/AcrR family transcriptional regulator, transcriptional repressor of aconitase